MLQGSAAFADFDIGNAFSDVDLSLDAIPHPDLTAFPDLDLAEFPVYKNASLERAAFADFSLCDAFPGFADRILFADFVS